MSFRPLNLPTPSSPSLYKLSVDEFKGVDKASGEDNFSPSRATDLQNFIRNKVGQVKKRGAFVAITPDRGVYHWIKNWEGGTASFEGEFVNVGGMDVVSILKDKWGTTEVKITHAVGEGIGKYFYLLLSCTDADKKTRYAAMRFEYTGNSWRSENILTYELKVQAFDDTETASTGAIGSIASAIVNAAVATLGKYNKVLPFMEFVPTPTIVSNASPKGGGNLFQSPNLLSPYVQETFCVTADDLTDGKCKRFQLSLQDIALTDGTNMISSAAWMENKDNKYWTTDTKGIRRLTKTGATILNRSVIVEKYEKTTLSSDDDTETSEQYDWEKVTGLFVEKKTDFVNTASAALWIPKAEIGVSPVEGEANVRITYIRNQDEYEDGLAELMACNQSTCYGVGGYKDRIFLAGGNKIFYSGMDDPMYFGELCYIEPCFKGVNIVAMGGQGQFLYAVDSDGITNVISGTVNEDDSATYLLDAAFVIADRVQGEKPIGSVLKVFGGEFCYLSEEGVVAIRHDNFYDKRYAQNRSRMLGDSIKGKIVGAAVWDNFLVIATSDQLFLLDELQQSRLEDYKYSGVQYEVFPFTFDMTDNGLGTFTITKVWATGNSLYFQMHKGDLYYTMKYDDKVFVDTITNGTDVNYTGTIFAEWITPQFYLNDVHRRKLIQDFYLAVGAEGDAVNVEYQTDNEKKWRELRPADGRFVPLWSEPFDYGTFSYYTEIPKLQMIVRRRPARPFYKIRFRFTSKGQHGLSLSSFGFYYKKEVI